MAKLIKAKKDQDLWAVVDADGFLIHRDGGSVSIFCEKRTAGFLAYEWADPSENLRVIKVKVTPYAKRKTNLRNTRRNN